MLDVVLYVLIMLFSLAAVALNVVSLPGNWVILLAGLGLSIAHGGHHPWWGVLVVIFLILLAAEGMEFLSGLVGTRFLGGSRAAAWAAVGGAVIGGIIGIPPITFATLGIDHIFAAVLGAFIAAWLVELIRQRTMKEALLAALGAALGRGTGLVTKIMAGLGAWAILAAGYWWPPW